MTELVNLLKDMDLINTVKEIGVSSLVIVFVIFVLLRSRISIQYNPKKDDKQDTNT